MRSACASAQLDQILKVVGRHGVSGRCVEDPNGLDVRANLLRLIQGQRLSEKVIDTRLLELGKSVPSAPLFLGPTLSLRFFEFGLRLGLPGVGGERTVAHGLLREYDDRRRDFAKTAL